MDPLDRLAAERDWKSENSTIVTLAASGPLNGLARKRNPKPFDVGAGALRAAGHRVIDSAAVSLLDIGAHPIAEHERDQHSYDACTLTHLRYLLDCGPGSCRAAWLLSREQAPLMMTTVNRGAS